MSSFHDEVLSATQATVLRKLGPPMGAKGFYLGVEPRLRSTSDTANPMPLIGLPTRDWTTLPA